ncbi:MAG: MraZ protein [Myxococcota bacterium]|jgi:MraZ protein
MFAGRYDHALDDKGRTMLPKRFRERLAAVGDSSIWVTHALGSPNHLDVRPDSSFQAYFTRISELPNDPVLMDFKRFYFGSAMEVELDSVGRMLVPAHFRQHVQLKDKIAFVGVDAERFQIWSPAALTDRFNQITQNPAAMMSHLAGLGV